MFLKKNSRLNSIFLLQKVFYFEFFLTSCTKWGKVYIISVIIKKKNLNLTNKEKCKITDNKLIKVVRVLVLLGSISISMRAEKIGWKRRIHLMCPTYFSMGNFFWTANILIVRSLHKKNRDRNKSNYITMVPYIGGAQKKW
jgi:hypothetical protein